MTIEIGHYAVEREIGRGGMAVVYLARQLELGRWVALKELAGLHARDPTLATRFLREAQLAGSLNHPNIVTVYEYFEDAGVPYIAMEYLPRGSLRPLVGSLTVANTLVVLDGILAGLSHAAEHRIVHRDLKPENVMRSDDGGVKIADFGIAKAHDDLATVNLTPAGEFLGAPAYVSPEQVLGAEANAASDLYAVGVIAFELLGGAVPFSGATGHAMLIKKVNERPPSLRSRSPELDRALCSWVDALLVREPERRPSDPREVRRELEEIAERLGGPRWVRGGALPAEVESAAGDVVAAERPEHRFAPLHVVAGHAPLPALVRHALTRPLSVSVALLVALLAIPLGLWLLPVAAVSYAALAAITVFDEAEAASAGRRP